ncbi:MAG: TonB-dependent receptor [Sphingomonas bacterium]|uniref:TonB-dependent receptor plug domain-containing protein n=1 Tax=Sphingomonas bacterium TaxID=1895847 RepID=UPI002639C89A|nr:TonB-dependent receptor [Sphingomonas bacterium]MDB5694901.1 TonB-dependent receptor [Sphingomonas bacterium]
MSCFSLFTSPTLAGVALLASAPLHAQTVPPCPSDQPGDACNNEGVLTPTSPRDVVVTATRVEQDRTDTGQAITVVTRADLDRRQTVALSDILATTPGVSVTRNGAIGGFTAVRLRGAEAEQTLVVIDGVRVNDPSSPGGGFDFATLLAGSVERVEVLRGPNSVPWGSQAIGGVVNVVTADPARLRDGDVTGRAQIEGGYAEHLYATAGVSGRTGALSGSLNAGLLRTDGISSAANGLERDGYRQIGATGRLGLAIAEGIGLDLRGYYADSRTQIDGFAPPTYAFGDTPERSTAQELYGYAGLNVRVGPVANRVAFTIADIDRDNFATAASATPSFLARGRTERFEYQADARLSDGLRLVVGAEREDSRFDDGFTFADTGVTSVHGQAIVKPVAALTVTGGVRYDDHDSFGGQVTAGADAALALGGGTVLRGSYGEGFKAPTLFQLFSSFGNATLQPEEAWSFDAGVQQTLLDGRAAVGVTYFHRDTRNQIAFRSCSAAERATAGSICVGRPFGTYDNIARARAEGVEIELSLQPTDALTLRGQVTILNAENRSAGANRGRDLARRPGETASVDADYRFPFGLRIGGTVSLVGDSFDNAANSVRLDGYALVSVRAELPLGDRLSLYGRVENAADAAYQTAAGYGSIGRAAYGGIRLRLD